MLNITEMANNLREDTAMQSTPMPVLTKDYVKIVVQAIKKYFVDVNHPQSYNQSLYITDENDDLFYDFDFTILDEEYIFILSKLKFMRRVFSDATGDSAVSYTTDALSVTGAKEAYKSIQMEIDDLEKERIRVFHKIMANEEN